MEKDRFDEIVGKIQWKKLCRLTRNVEIGCKILHRECLDQAEINEFVEEAVRRFENLMDAMGESLYQVPPRLGYIGDDTLSDGIWAIVAYGSEAYDKVMSRPAAFWSYFRNATEIMRSEGFCYILNEVSDNE